jgi:hypothetical protein
MVAPQSNPHTEHVMHPQPSCTANLLDIIGFKWLMAREGHRVHVQRLQSDPDYASECLAMAAASEQEALVHAARRLHAQMGAR